MSQAVHEALEKKKAKVAAFLDAALDALPPDSGHPRRYLGWFYCFDTQHYYEAHDVLETLWHDQGRKHPDFAFLKGLIQVAGAFVHMKLHHQHPDHKVHGARLEPATRLFALARKNLEPYGPRHLGLDVAGLLEVCGRYDAALHRGEYAVNPWTPDTAPTLGYPSEEG